MSKNADKVDSANPSEASGNDEQANTVVWATKWLSEERLAPYLATCGNDIEIALDLYEWNIALAQVIVRDVSHFEVALRNAYDGLMRERWDGGSHWLLDDASPARRPIMRKAAKGELDVNRINRRLIDGTSARLREGFTTGALVSSLTLGFWVHLTDRSREAELWRTNLYLAWPKGTNRAELQRSLEGILRVRNRASHSERLFDPSRPELSPKTVCANIASLFRALCPEAAERIYSDSLSPVDRFLEENPSPVPVKL